MQINCTKKETHNKPHEKKFYHLDLPKGTGLGRGIITVGALVGPLLHVHVLGMFPQAVEAGTGVRTVRAFQGLFLQGV